jgi:hypothetical protein
MSSLPEYKNIDSIYVSSNYEMDSISNFTIKETIFRYKDGNNYRIREEYQLSSVFEALFGEEQLWNKLNGTNREIYYKRFIDYLTEIEAF